MTSNSILTKDHASVPGAVPAFQRSPSTNIAYRGGEEFLDKWRGRLDRAVARATLAATDEASACAVDTPWLQALGDACRGHLEGERRSTDAMLATLDHSLAAAYQQLASLQERRDNLAEVRKTIVASEPMPDARRVAADGTDVAMAQATRDRKAHLTTATGEVAAIDEQIAELQLQIATLLEDRSSQWKLLLTRCAQILAHFDRRAATYASRATRGATVRIAPTRVVRPAWLSQPAPPAPHPGDATPTSPTH